MRKINYQDLQLDIEKKFATEIDKDAKSAFFDYDDLSVINYQEEKHFHNLLIDTISFPSISCIEENLHVFWMLCAIKAKETQSIKKSDNLKC